MKHKIKKRSFIAWIMMLTCIGVAIDILNTSPVFAGDILTRVQEDEEVNCGVPEPLAGFCDRDENGRWRGFLIDFCRAVAVAALNDPEKATFIPLSPPERLPVLLSGRIDLLAHLTTWTFSREAGIGIKFPVVYFYDGHTFMTPKDKGIRKIKDLDGAVICVVNKTNHQTIVRETFKPLGIKFTPLVVQTQDEMVKALQDGRCQACIGPASWLAAIRAQIPGGLNRYDIMKGTISKEPLCPAVLQEDEEWLKLVRWVLFALIEAEELGVTRANVRDLQQQSADPRIQWLLNLCGQSGKELGLKPDWVADVIAAVGNYGEMFERNLGTNSGLKIERGLNRLWNQGGLLYSPPFN